MTVLRSQAAQELAPGRGVVKQVPDFHRRAYPGASLLQSNQLSPFYAHLGTQESSALAGQETQAGNRGDTGQRLPTKTKCAHRSEVVFADNLAGCEALKYQRYLGSGDTGAIVGDLDETASPFLHLHAHGIGGSIEGVFDQLLHHARWPLDDLAGSDFLLHFRR